MIAQPGRAWGRLAIHGFAGWALCAATMGVLLATVPLRVALVLHALAAPLIFTAIARRYFRPSGARDPLPTAAIFTAIVALLDLTIVAGLVQRSLVMFGSIVGAWLPLLLIFLATWVTGAALSTMPWPKPRATESGAGGGSRGVRPHVG